MFKTNQVVYLKREWFVEQDTKELDFEGFKVLAPLPDLDETIPVQRVSDGEYSCMPVWVLSAEREYYHI